MKVFDGLHAFLWQSPTANNANTYLIDGPHRVLIDPGHRALFGHVEGALAEIGLGLEQIDVVICTHGHPDHIEAVERLRKAEVRFAMHPEEWRWMEGEGRRMSASLGIEIDGYEPDFFIAGGQLRIGDLHLAVYHSPGHSPGSICLHWPEKGALFSGDVLFDRGIGRTDLPGGDGNRLKESIRTLAQLDVTCLLPGHGDLLTDRSQVRHNFEQVQGSYFAYI